MNKGNIFQRMLSFGATWKFRINMVQNYVTLYISWPIVRMSLRRFSMMKHIRYTQIMKVIFPKIPSTLKANGKFEANLVQNCATLYLVISCMDFFETFIVVNGATWLNLDQPNKKIRKNFYSNQKTEISKTFHILLKKKSLKVFCILNVLYSMQ